MSDPLAWQENTRENPFWKSAKPIEVQFKDGTTGKLGCPRCAQRLTGVERFRETTIEKFKYAPISK